MAIKGKSKKKGGRGRAGSLSPKPVIVERKPPLLSRKPVRIGIVSVLALAAILGGLRVWQNVSRSNDLKAYDRALVRAQGLLTQHLDPQALTGLGESTSQFGSNKLDSARFKELAALWEKDFKQSKDLVAKLKPPKQLLEAQQLILQGMEGYVGVARLYQLAADQRKIAQASADLAKTTKDPALKKKLEAQSKSDADQVQVIMLHATEWRQRADAVYDLGKNKVEELKSEWGLNSGEPPVTVPSGITVQ